MYSHHVLLVSAEHKMYRCNYQNLESKQWSMTAVLGVTALLSVSVGATAGFIASQPSTTSLYAPASTTTSISSVAAIPVSQAAARAPVQAVPVSEAQSVEQSIYTEAPQVENLVLKFFFTFLHCRPRSTGHQWQHLLLCLRPLLPSSSAGLRMK